MPFSYVLYGRGRNIAFLLRRYTFLLKLPRNYGIFFLKEEKEEVWEDNRADFRPVRSWITQIFSADFFYFPQISQMHTDY